MNEIVNKFLLVGNKFMPEMHLKQPGFTYSASGPFTKNKERIEKFMPTGNTDIIYKNEFDRAYFQHDMAYGKTKDLGRRTQSINVSRNKAFKIASDPKYDGYERGLASMVYKFFDKTLVEVVSLMNKIINWQRSFINQLFKNSKKIKFIRLSETIFGLFI